MVRVDCQLRMFVFGYSKLEQAESLDLSSRGYSAFRRYVTTIVYELRKSTHAWESQMCFISVKKENVLKEIERCMYIVIIIQSKESLSLYL